MKKVIAIFVLAIALQSCSKKDLAEPTSKALDKQAGKILVDNDIKASRIYIPTGPPNAMDIMGAYSTGFQTGWGLRTLGSPTAFPSFTSKVMSSGEQEMGSPSYGAAPIDIRTGMASNTYQVNGSHWVKIIHSTNNERLYIWSEATSAAYTQILGNFLTNYCTDNWYDSSARLGLYDGLAASSPYAVGPIVTLDGVTYTLPWPTNCPGCEPF